METPEINDENSSEPQSRSFEPVNMVMKPAVDILDGPMWKKFFKLTGGSVFYCLSALFVAYGIIQVISPILSDKQGTLFDARWCIITLHGYELALLGVLILIVSRKVIDDAISLVILIALFLIGTSMALGSVVDKDVTAGFYVGLGAMPLAMLKLYALRRWVRIPLRFWSELGLVILVLCNYLGPVLLAHKLSVDPGHEAARRVYWLGVYLTMLIGVGLVVIEAMRTAPRSEDSGSAGDPFLRSPVMVYLFTAIVLAAGGVHLSSMAFIFTLERVFMDNVPVILLLTLLVMEIVRHCGKRFGLTEILLACVPLAAVMLAIDGKSVLESGRFGPGLMCYPPVTLGLAGLVLAGMGLYHKWYPLLVVVVFYGLGVVLTLGYSPVDPYDLNTHACVGILIAAMLGYGLIKWNPYLCLGGVAVLSVGLYYWDPFASYAQKLGLSLPGGLSGVCGLGVTGLYLLFGQQIIKAVRVFGMLCLAGFVLDYLPETYQGQYLIVLVGSLLVMTALWLRVRDIVAIIILWAPYLVRLFLLSKRISHWRFVILGFILLAVGTVVSLRKRNTQIKSDYGI
ncbi:MAG: hypothetical protein JW860_10115 [Sedimentisphaerales bacterium]|nr:hypothetical protein [Sedimentisphaerales bacterium]